MKSTFVLFDWCHDNKIHKQSFHTPLVNRYINEKSIYFSNNSTNIFFLRESIFSINFINKHSIQNRIYNNKNDIDDDEYEYFVISIGTKTQRDQNVEDAQFSISD